MKKYVIFLCGTALLAACTRCPENPEPEPLTGDLVFWAMCGECIPLTDTFTLHDGKLYDKQGEPLPDSLFQLAQTLLTDFPGELCASTREDYGCGACYDLISYFVQASCDEKVRIWQFDPYDDNIPAPVKAYAQSVQEVFWACVQ